MIRNSQYDLILRLKQQARHGMANNDDNEKIRKKLEKPINISNVSVIELGKALKDVLDITTALNNNLNKLNVGFAQSTGLNVVIGALDELAQSYKNIVTPSLQLENRNAQLNKGFGINSIAAGRLAGNLQSIAKEYKFTAEQTSKYAVSIKKMLPLVNQSEKTIGTKFYQGLQKVQDIMQTNLGLDEQQASSYAQYAASQNESADASLRVAQAVAKAMGDESGDLGYFAMITTEIAGLSENIQLQYGKVPGNLETAVIKAKKFGLSIEQIAKASSDMLQIETSIGQELEYQLLSGRRLVDQVSGKSLTNTFREAALRGDMNAQADAMNKILEQEGETLENNLFARKQMAELLGMDEKSLSSALQKKKILDKAAASGITIDLDGSNALEQAAEAVKKGALDPTDFEALKKATNNQTTEEILAQLLEVDKEALIYEKLAGQAALIEMTRTAALAGRPNLQAKNLKGLTEDKRLETIGTLTSGYLLGNELVGYGGGTSLVDKIKKSSKQGGRLLKGGLNQTSAGDVVIPPGSSKAILMGPDQINLRDDDMVIAGTNLGGTGGNNTNMQTFANMIVAAINNQTAQLKQNDRLFGGGINAPYYG